MTIHKCKVKGLYPAFLANSKRLSHNLIQVIDSIAPYHMPGGGGFSIMQFTLNGLYELFQKGQNIWTKSNCDLPLVKYNGCTLKMYRAENYDYVVTIQRCYPMCCNDIMYMSCHPFVMLMTKGRIIVPCRKSNPNKKPYKKRFILPPAQWQSKWYFQTDISKTGFLLLKTVACSLDRIYTGSTASSTTIGITTLTTRTFQFHNWKNPPSTTGYKPQDNMYFWGALQAPNDPNKTPTKDLIYLGRTGLYTEGEPLQSTTNIDTYFTSMNKWGNIFHPNYLSGNNQVYISNQSPTQLKDKLKQNIDKTIDNWTDNVQYITPRTLPLLTQCRYNPLADKGIDNKIFLISNTSDVEKWHEPTNIKLMRQGFPLWILTWGWLDWQLKLGEVHRLETEYMTVIQSKYIEPYMEYYLLLDDNFTQNPGTSPYGTPLNQSDFQNWFPKNNFQLESLNTVACSGPGTIKLHKDQSTEAHIMYNFHLKFGGCPAPMEKICNPIGQTKYPVPNNQLETTSLQSPETPIETYLYSFDERRGLLTEPAAKRIKKDFTTQTTLLPITGTEMDVRPPIQETPIETTSASEEEDEASVQEQLLQLRRKQLQLKRRILKLLKIQTM